MTRKLPARKRQTSAGDRKSIIVTSSGVRPIHEVVEDLKTAGFQVDQVMDSIGSITGHAHSTDKKKLSRIRGVADVAEDHPINIGPPGAAVS